LAAGKASTPAKTPQPAVKIERRMAAAEDVKSRALAIAQALPVYIKLPLYMKNDMKTQKHV
jgi:hypothetical protein